MRRGLVLGPRPVCPEHGRMCLGSPGYHCHGFDGEGCDYTVPLKECWVKVTP